MDFKNYYEKNKTYITFKDYRIKRILSLVSEVKPRKILDIGCGNGYLMDEILQILPQSDLTGVDVYAIKRNTKWKYKKADITKGLPFKDNEFDYVILGEVIEHVPNPDFVLREIRRVIKKKGKLIISTPNLVSWANRIMVLFGIQPLFTETSNEVNLGRHFKLLGQGEKVQGHLKIFTYKSLEEILMKEKYTILKKEGVTFFFPFPISLIDSFFKNFISLSSGLLYISEKK